MSRKNHRFGITLRSEFSKAEAFEALQKSLDVGVLNDAGVYIMAWDWTPTKTTGKPGGNGSESSVKTGLFSLLSKAPGLAAFLKKFKWWQIYVGFAVVVLMAQFIWNLAH